MAFNKLPADIQKHITGLVKLIPDAGEDTLELYSDVWMEKDRMFRSQMSSVGMKLVETADPGEGNGILALTNSGSLVSLSPGKEERVLEYSSIKLRTDVPDIIIDKISKLPESIKNGMPVVFPEGRVSRTSPVHLIAVCTSEVPQEEQYKRVREATIFLTNGFMKLNRSLHLDPANVPDQYTMKSMVRYVAKKNSMTAGDVKTVIDDFLYLIETGLTLGETVPLGRIGRFSAKKKDAQKARIVRHPATGEEITVEAKPSIVVPKISFSSYLKEQLAELPASENDTIER